MTARLEAIEIENFRSIAGAATIPLDADIVLVHGLNGAGKTSVLSAIELAATGTISHLEHADDSEYLKHLVNRGSTTGRIALKLRGLDLEPSDGYTIDSTGARGQAALNGELRNFFVERCLLPQTTLGRLLEIYAPGGNKSSQSPLVNFVKSLVGLDSLDSLIEGLTGAAHIARAHKLSPSWRHAQTLSDGADRELAAKADELAKAAHSLSLADQTLRTLLDLDAQAPPESVARLAEARLLSWSPKVYEDLARVDLQVRALQETVQDIAETAAGPSTNSISLEKSLAKWWGDGDGKFLLAGGSQVGALVGIGNWTTKTAVAQALETRAALDKAQDSNDVAVSAREILQRQHDDALSNAQLANLRLNENAALRSNLSVSSDIRELTAMLSLAIPLLSDDMCPLCDQQFDQEGLSLQKHVHSKISKLSEQAQRSLQLENVATALEKQQKEHLNSQEAARRELSDIDDTETLAKQAKALFEGQEVLKRLGHLIQSAQEKEAEIRAVRALEAQSLMNEGLSNEVASKLRALSSTLSVDLPSEPLRSQVEYIRAETSKALAKAEAAEENFRNLQAAVDSNQQAEEVYKKVASALAADEESALSIRAALREAARRKESASAFRREAEKVRSKTMRGVFDERLNQTWSDLFQRLAPSEPFVPRFKRSDKDSRTIDIELETVDRSGIPAASPGAMLSYGNVNTAALSLFLALHFAVKPTLPWLILDDPIQSMDDVHVANFAALLKQLARRNGRQVIVAVHQRELFEYLKLELTPAAPGQDLLAISVEKADDSTTSFIPERFNYREEQSISVA